jgi:Disaggregatase related
VALAALVLSSGVADAATPCARFAGPAGSDTAAGTFAAPFKTAQKLAGSLTAGQTGCLRGGTYTAGTRTYVLSPPRGGNPGAPITIRSYPGERARLVGIVNVSTGVNNVTLSNLTFEGTGGMNTIKIYANDVVVQNSEITNAWRGLSCMMLGSSSGVQALRPIVRANKLYACGSRANGTKDHGIYAANLLQGQIVDNVIYDSAAYAIQLYPNAQRTRFAHNVVDGGLPSVRGGLVFGGDSRYASRDNVVEQNIIVNAQTYNIVASWGGATGSGNIARSNCLWNAKQRNIYNGGGLTTSANVIADPTFVDRAARNYRLKPGSRCLSVVGYDTAAKLAAANSTTTTQQIAAADSIVEPTPTLAPRAPDPGPVVDPGPVAEPAPRPEPAPQPEPAPLPEPILEPEPISVPDPTTILEPGSDPGYDPVFEPDPTTILEPGSDPSYDPVFEPSSTHEPGPSAGAVATDEPSPASHARGRAHGRKRQAKAHAHRRRHAGRRSPWGGDRRVWGAGRLYEPSAGSLRSRWAAPMQWVWLAPSVSFSPRRSR